MTPPFKYFSSFSVLLRQGLLKPVFSPKDLSDRELGGFFCSALDHPASDVLLSAEDEFLNEDENLKGVACWIGGGGRSSCVDMRFADQGVENKECH
jgi:hypothetical protein